MKKLTVITILISTLLACSLPSFPFALGAQSIPSPSPTKQPTQTPNPTSTLTPTLRNTATSVLAFLLQTPQYTPPVLLNVKTVTPIPGPTSSIPGPGFKSVKITEFKIYWGICKPRTTVMTVEMQNPDEVGILYLFFRLASQKKDDTTPWVGTVLDRQPNGTFTYVLRANLIPHRKDYTKAWVQFEFAAADKHDVVFSRSQIYTRSISLAPCP